MILAVLVKIAEITMHYDLILSSTILKPNAKSLALRYNRAGTAVV